MVVWAYSISSLLMVLLPVFLAAVLRKRYRAPWLLFSFGALLFILSQVVHIPLNNWLVGIGFLPSGQAVDDATLWKMAVIIGVTAGLCEELARVLGFWLIKRFQKQKALSFSSGLMLGMGHGGFESMFFGGVTLVATIGGLIALRGVDLQTMGLTADQMVYLEKQLQMFTSSPFNALTPLLERMIALVIHVSLSVMVWKAFQKRNPLYVIVAILIHALFDMVAVIVAYRLSNPWLIEGLLLLLILPLAAWLVWTGRKESGPSFQSASFGREFQLFLVALKKELRYQWFTRRSLIILVVFSLFGISSPLMAYFMPQIIGSMSGTEMFASLIPEPSVTDAIAQYIKNLSQFGFILVVLLGMAAVVNEKERGTAALILSKPMPRWAFLTSKFFAQALVYAAAFLIACLGGFYYTWYLFGTVSFGDFLLLNVLMLAWLLPFLGMTLLGSTLGKTTAAAGGFGFGLCVLLMVAQYLPTYGAFAPGGLIAWASQLGSGSAITTNAGALMMSLVLTILEIITALGVFERQEL